MQLNKHSFIGTAALLLFFFSFSFSSQAQDAPDVAQLPEYIVVSVYNRLEVVGGINVYIDQTKAKGGDEVQNLSNYLSEKKSGEKVFNWTDLLNTMYALGFEYVQSVPTQQDMGNVRQIEDGLDAAVGGHGEFELNVVFRKIK